MADKKPYTLLPVNPLWSMQVVDDKGIISTIGYIRKDELLGGWQFLVGRDADNPEDMVGTFATKETCVSALYEYYQKEGV